MIGIAPDRVGELGRAIGAAEGGHVGGDHAGELGNRPEGELPVVRRDGIAVHEHDRLPLRSRAPHEHR